MKESLVKKLESLAERMQELDALLRITSYNVCYTKLLRPLAPFPDSFERVLGPVRTGQGTAPAGPLHAPHWVVVGDGGVDDRQRP